MRSLFYSLLGYFLTPPGLLFMAALDSTVVFFLPLGVDVVLIVLSARKPELFWLYALLATVGSVVGAALTFWLGRKIGEVGLTKLIKPSRLKRVEEKVGHKAGASVALLGIIPPPFPFTAFVLTSGALKCNAWTFLGTLGAVRLVRFGLEAGLAAYYGRRILTWMESTVFETIVAVLIVLALAGTVVSAVTVWRSTRKDRSRRVPAA